MYGLIGCRSTVWSTLSAGPVAARAVSRPVSPPPRTRAAAIAVVVTADRTATPFLVAGRIRGPLLVGRNGMRSADVASRAWDALDGLVIGPPVVAVVRPRGSGVDCQRSHRRRCRRDRGL